ncbi:MAG: hypothetical protein JWO85_786 [Candidatus Eremiobacteraeota bacterium]|nr:hypothetical protein [Candidatus Eremiobacteraeota bacterium]
MRSALLTFAVVVGSVLLVSEATRGALPAPHPGSAAMAPPPGAMPDPCPSAKPAPDALRLPAHVPPGDPIAIETKMLGYLQTYGYRKLGWCVDKSVRDTGPYVHGQYFGTHPAVRIYYSPEMIAWLRGGRVGVPHDGAVMIKEQYGPPPAARYAGLSGDQLTPTDWTVMIRRSSASKDGWFWAEVYTGMFAPPQPAVNTAYQNAGFGLYCLRCHGSAAHALTFASTANIAGFPGEPLTFFVDNSWRTPQPHSSASAVPAAATTEHEKNRDPALRNPMIAAHAPTPIQTFPAEPLDTFVAAHAGAGQFLTSDQCMGCHSAASGPIAGPMMWLTPPPFPSPTPTPAPNAGAIGVNVSEYGEWRWSPMGLAGRDPVFFSQLEGELAYIDSIPAARIEGGAARAPHTRMVLKQQIVDTCMQCHGVMGKRTFAIDHPPPSTATFSPDFVFQADPKDPNFHYGGLARDGVSCTVCHHAMLTPPEEKSLSYTLEHRANGLFAVGPPDKLYGPFETKTIASHPMKESLGTTPIYSSLTTTSRLCTSCHSINLPIVDGAAKIHPIDLRTHHDVEQATYVEWVNSKFQTEYKPGPDKRSCQDCHMPTSVVNDRLDVTDRAIQTKIAIVQDEDYPQAEHRAPLADITVPWRTTGFRRHELLGLNAFLLRTFQQNPDVLGVRLADYMSGSKNDLGDAIGNVVQQAEHQTARVDLDAKVENGTLVANVAVTNLTGHRFPSGVGFRRAFVELTVTDPQNGVVFASGRTDANGVIVGPDGVTPLHSEFFVRGPGGAQQYQPHYDQQYPVTSADQVQIFEELVRDHAGDFTESFIRRDSTVKDNRLLPAGWRFEGVPGFPLPANWVVATRPAGVRGDPHYGKDGGRGRAVVAYRVPLRTAVDPAKLKVSATLWYQSWSPYFRRLRTTGTGPAAVRLKVLLANLHPENTALDSWKLKIATKSVAPAP